MFGLGVLGVIFRKQLGLGGTPTASTGVAALIPKLLALVNTLPHSDDVKHTIFAELQAVLQKWIADPNSSGVVGKIDTIFQRLDDMLLAQSRAGVSPVKQPATS